jgi:sec-independent protein translocase protein TatA
MMPQLGAPELIIILVIIVLIFGVGKLPEVGQALGKGIREFRGAAEGQEDDDPAAPAAKPAGPAAVDAPRPAGAVEAPRQPAVPVVAPVATDVSRPAAPVAAAGAVPATAAATTVYVVVDGDTLETIAQSNQVSIEDLMAANGYSQKDRVLYAGDKIQVPSKTA